MNAFNPTPSPSLRTRRRDEDRARIYQVALALIQEKGYEATTIRDIAGAAEVAVGTFFNHFPGKDHLLVDYYLQLQVEVARDLGQPHGSCFTFLEAFRELIFRQVRTHPQLYRAIGPEMATSPALQEVEKATCGDMHGRLARALAGGRARGEIRAEVDPESTASLILLAFNGAIFDTLPGLGEAFESRTHHYLDQLVLLLRA